MSILGRYTKQPAERESYSIDYADDLVDADGIASAVVTVSPEGLTLVSHFIIGTRVKVFVGDGVLGAKHKVTVTAETDDGRVMQDEFIVAIKDY